MTTKIHIREDANDWDWVEFNVTDEDEQQSILDCYLDHLRRELAASFPGAEIDLAWVTPYERISYRGASVEPCEFDRGRDVQALVHADREQAFELCWAGV